MLSARSQLCTLRAEEPLTARQVSKLRVVVLCNVLCNAKGLETIAYAPASLTLNIHHDGRQSLSVFSEHLKSAFRHCDDKTVNRAHLFASSKAYKGRTFHTDRLQHPLLLAHWCTQHAKKLRHELGCVRETSVGNARLLWAAYHRMA